MLIGIAGPSGSGKTHLANLIKEKIGEDKVLILSMDRYYKGIEYSSEDEAWNYNFDTPEAFDWEKMVSDVRDLISGKKVKVPIYSYEVHKRVGYEWVLPKKVIILEGIFVLVDEKLNKMMDLRLYVDTPLDICLIRRLKRDISERKFSIERNLNYWIKFIRPGYETFVLPSARKAHLIIPEDPDGRMRETAVEAVIGMVERKLRV